MQSANLRQIMTAIRDQAFDFASESVLRHRGRRRGQAAHRNLSRYMAELEELIKSYRTFATTLTLSTSVERATRRKLLKKTLRVVGPATDARQEEKSSWRGRGEGRQS